MRHLPLGSLNLDLRISACAPRQWAGLACQSARCKGSYPFPKIARDICTWARQFFSACAAVLKLFFPSGILREVLLRDFWTSFSRRQLSKRGRSAPEASNRACPDFRKTATCVDTHRSRQQKVGSPVRPGCLRQAGCRVANILHSYGRGNPLNCLQLPANKTSVLLKLSQRANSLAPT